MAENRLEGVKRRKPKTCVILEKIRLGRESMKAWKGEFMDRMVEEGIMEIKVGEK